MNEKTMQFSAPLTVKKYDYWFIFLFSYLYIRWDLLWTGSGFGVSLFTILICGFFYLRMSMDGPIPEEHRKTARPWALVIALSALSCSWFDYSTLSWFTFLFLTVAFLYWTTTLGGKRFLPELSAYLPLELLTGFLSVPFANFGRFFGAVFRTKAYREAVNGDEPVTIESENESVSTGAESAGNNTETSASVLRRNSRRRILRNLMMIGITLIMLGPLLLIVLNLLASADVEFMFLIQDMIDRFFNLFDGMYSGQILETISHLFLAIPVTCYLFGLLWAHTRPDHAKGWKTKDKVDSALASFRFVPRIMIYTGLSAFSVIYVLFLGLQASHLIDALTGGLPDSTTYSAFARQGFFELCAVAFINLMIMTGVWLIGSRRQSDGTERIAPVLRLLLAFLSLQTILLVITAMTKMGLYIETYGLTRLRVYTSWFMLWLLLVFAVLTMTHLRTATSRGKGNPGEAGSDSCNAQGRFAPAKVMTVLTVTMFLALSYINVDALIVRDNLERYSASQMSLEDLDLYGLIHLSDNAAMEVLDYYEERLGTNDTGQDGRLMEEVARWISLVEPEYRLPDEKAHWTVTSLRLNQRLNALKSL